VIGLCNEDHGGHKQQDQPQEVRDGLSHLKSPDGKFTAEQR
jgi:hypothetical protein